MEQEAIIPDSLLVLICDTCGKRFIRPRWVQRSIERRRDRRGTFCSKKCGATGRIQTEETKQKISESQLGISVPGRGRKGHAPSNRRKDKR